MNNEFTVRCKYYRTHWMQLGKWSFFTRCAHTPKTGVGSSDYCEFHNRRFFDSVECNSFKIDWIKYITTKEHFEDI